MIIYVMNMPTPIRPVWTERDRPTTQLIDVPFTDTTEGLEDRAVSPPTDTSNSDYISWVNYYKQPLHVQLRQQAIPTTDRLMALGVDPVPIAQVTANILGVQPYPRHRLSLTDDAEQLTAYKHAIQANFMDRTPRYIHGGPAAADFIPPLHFIRLSADHAAATTRVELADTVAHMIGIASLAPVVNISIVQREGTHAAYWWFGTTWRQSGLYYGEMLLETAAIKLAAEARRRLGYTSRTSNTTHPAIAPYQRTQQLPSDANGAIALDLLNRAAGYTDPLAIYKPLWAFALSGAQDQAARQETAAIINRATNGRLPLEALEAVPYSPQGFSIRVLRRIEELAGFSGQSRPSASLSTEPR